MTDREKGKPAAPVGPPRKRPRETPADRARIGTVIANTYRIDEIIGRGAIGAVFSAMHLRLERAVAVKFVDPSLVDDPEIRARFKREAKISASIGSAHAVEVLDYGVSEEGAPFIVMERLVGEDLHARILREGTLPVDRALRIAKQVCRAIGAAHANGIVHRDLKPENVFLVERDGEPEFVKVVDFGLSTFIQSDDTRLTRAGQSVGTPLYMAPEQAGARAFDARVDVYSLGVLIFEMTTGRLPFEAPNLQQLLVALATQAPRSVRYYKPSLPQELDDLILRFIARDPRVRPKSAAAALAEIVALEERLAARLQVPSSRPKTPGELAIDGLPGELPDSFVNELHGHLTELRRTGRLATSEIDVDDANDPGRESGGGDRTDPMDRREINERLNGDAASSDNVPVAPRAAGKPAHAERERERERHRRHSKRHSTKTPRAPRPDEVVDEDSGVFIGRIGEDNKPHEIPHARRPSSRPPPPPSHMARKRVGGPPIYVLVLAAALFAVVATLVVLKMLQR
jgi:serine/threonine protein kinase